MAEEEDKPEEVDQELAHGVLGKFLGSNPEIVIDLFERMKDPVIAAAVAVRVCYELDPTQIADFLAILEDESLDDDDGDDPDPDAGEADDPKK